MSMEAVTKPASFAGNVDHLLEKLHYRTIVSDEDLDEVLRLRYDAYLREGAITPNSDTRLIDRYDDLDNAANIGVYHNDSLIAAMRIHFLSKPDDMSPSLTAFEDVLRPHLEAGKRMVDPNRFVVDYETARKFPHLAYVTMRLSVIASAYFDAHYSIASIRMEHRAFYKRSFFATPAAPPRLYPGLTKKLCLMMVDYGNDREKIVARSSFYESTQEEQVALFGRIQRGNNSCCAAAAA
jgi:hypothetical protein